MSTMFVSSQRSCSMAARVSLTYLKTTRLSLTHLDLTPLPEHARGASPDASPLPLILALLPHGILPSVSPAGSGPKSGCTACSGSIALGCVWRAFVWKKVGVLPHRTAIILWHTPFVSQHTHPNGEHAPTHWPHVAVILRHVGRNIAHFLPGWVTQLRKV